MVDVSIEERLLFRDLELPEEPTAPLRATPTGDLRTLAGRPNYRAATRRRAVTSPGTLVFRPEYGAGLEESLERPASAAAKSNLVNNARRNFLRDPRTEEIIITIADGVVPSSVNNPFAVTIDLTAKLKQRIGDELLSLEFGG